MTAVSGVILDLGGVVFESPIRRIAEFERAAGLRPRTVAHVIGSSGPNGAWPRLERGEMDRASFFETFAAEFESEGLTVDVRALLEEIEAALVVRPAMLHAIDEVRESGVVVAALTNNWAPMSDLPVARHFDIFVESLVEGCRKPDPEIYLRTLSRMACEPTHTLMLDDLGENLKTARALGLSTHKVVDPDEAIVWLLAQLGSVTQPAGGSA